MFEPDTVPSVRLLLDQMSTLASAADTLPPTEAGRLLEEIAVLTSDLEAAERGEAESGWTTVPVVNRVEDICRVDDLIGWTVQP
jgi:hypothetical protein